MRIAACGSSVVISRCRPISLGFRTAALRMGMRLEVQLAPPPIGYVRVELGRREVRVAEHLLHAAQVGSPLEEMRRERVAEQVGMDAARLEPGLLGEPPQDEERAGAGERAAARVQEE